MYLMTNLYEFGQKFTQNKKNKNKKCKKCKKEIYEVVNSFHKTVTESDIMFNDVSTIILSFLNT